MKTRGVVCAASVMFIAGYMRGVETLILMAGGCRGHDF